MSSLPLNPFLIGCLSLHFVISSNSLSLHNFYTIPLLVQYTEAGHQGEEYITVETLFVATIN
jgi:hypothetical protein